jgi:hypothetical protein
MGRRDPLGNEQQKTHDHEDRSVCHQALIVGE